MSARKLSEGELQSIDWENLIDTMTVLANRCRICGKPTRNDDACCDECRGGEQEKGAND